MVRVAFQGEQGAFSEDAIIKFFGAIEVIASPQIAFDDVVASVCDGKADYGVLPVENTIVGVIADSERAMATSSLRRVGEVSVPVQHCLLGVRGARLRDVLRVMSHPAALLQCARFFSTNYRLQALAVDDTAGAARQVAESGDPSIAAIASKRAADLYGLDILAEGIQDRADNHTRFVVVKP